MSRTKGSKNPARTYKDNFWSRKRVENNLQTREIAELLDIKVKTASAYFTGQCVPHEEQIKILCEYFDVDLIEGTREFYNAHKSYDAEHHRVLKLSAKTKNKIKEKTKPTPKFEIEEPDEITKVAELIAKKNDRIYEAVYNSKIGYKEFKAFIEYVTTHSYDDVKEWLYGKVDFDTYNKVTAILEEYK